jgi:serine/threonine-protein kinase
LPELRTTLLDRAEVAGVLQVALVAGVVKIPLDSGPTSMGPHSLALVAVGMAAPVEIRAEMVGVPEPGLYPLKVDLLDEAHRPELQAFVDGTDDVPPLSQDGEQLEGTNHRISLSISRSDLPPELQQEAEDFGLDVREPEPFEFAGKLGALESDRPPDSGALGIDLLPLVDDGELETPNLQGPTSRDRGAPEPSPWPPVSRDAPEAPGLLDSRGPAIEIGGGSALDSGSRDARRDVSPSPPPVDIHVDVAEVQAPESGQLVGRVLGNGRYEILEEIGEGGMGSVYLAHHRRLDKRIAVKVLHGSLRKDPTFVERFHREALSASKLDHRNVTRVLDFGEEEDGLLYIVMELLDGTELAEILDDQGALPLAQAVEVMVEVCAALAVAHDKGIVHRDIKPANIVMVPHRRDDGTDATLAKVCDFGIAMAQGMEQDGSKPQRRLTQAGMFHGTPAYMSPEQIREGEIDARSDIYACGVLLFELLTGTLPFDSESIADLLLLQLHQDPPPPSVLEPELGPEVDDVVLQALAKDPADRQQTARELREQLRALVRRPASRASDDDPDFLDPGLLDDTVTSDGTVVERLGDGAGDESGIDLDVDSEAAPHPRSPAAALVGGLPLDHEASGLADLVAGLAAGMGAADAEQLGLGERTPRQAMGDGLRQVLRGREELTLVRADERPGAEWRVRSGTGEGFELRQLVDRERYPVVHGALSRALDGLGIVSLTFREGLVDPDLDRLWRRLVGRRSDGTAAENQGLGFTSPHLGAVTASQRIGRARRLAWAVDLCLSRLQQDLRAADAPAEGSAGEIDEQLRKRLASGFRALHTEEAHGLLAHADLVAEKLGERSGWSAAALVELVIDAFDVALAAKVTKVLMLEQESTDNRALLDALTERLTRDDSEETVEVLRELHDQGRISFEQLPRPVQVAIRAGELAERLHAAPARLLQALDTIDDLERYQREVYLLEHALRLLAERERLATLWRVVSHLQRFAGGALPGEGSREAMAARAAACIADRPVLAPVVDALLAGSHEDRDAARALVVAAGAPAAALLYERRQASGGGRGERARFVGTVREMGRAAIPMIRDALARAGDA